MLATKNTVTKLLPQGSPMIMVDTLISHDDQHTVTAFTIKKENIFVVNGRFSEAGLIENMAQSAALRTGWMAMQRSDSTEAFRPPVGVIGAVKGFMLYQLPDIDTSLETEIIVLTEIFNATMIKASIKAGKKLLAEGELKIFIQDQSNS